MSGERRVARGAVRYGALSGFVLVACCGGATPPKKPEPLPGPCKLTNQTRFPEDPRLVKNLGKFTPPPEPTPDELDGHCRGVWQTVVLDKHCGDVVIPDFCATCSAEEQPKCTEGNGRGLVMQRCREEALAIFQANYATCGDFVLCAGKLQAKTFQCKAGRQ